VNTNTINKLEQGALKCFSFFTQIWSKFGFLRKSGFELLPTTSYHEIANGQLERAIQNIKNMKYVGAT
jgi:hypothetical protein